jgi:histidine ammonia-lyase
LRMNSFNLQSNMNYFYYGKDHLTANKAFDILNRNIIGSIDPNTKKNIAECAATVQKIASRERTVYGINTGFGPLCSSRISPEKTKELQRKILLSHSVGVGKPISKELAKLMMVLKVHALAKGVSGVSIEVIDRILWHIDEDIIPIVPEQGSVGASGDLAPLAHLFLPLIGEGTVHYKGDIVESSKVLNQFGLSKVELSAKDGLALINGTQFIAAHALQVVDSFFNCLWHADLIGAMMLEGLQGSPMPFHKALHEQRPHKGSVYVARKISEYLENSQIVLSHAGCDRVQDPYSLRCMPQVHGASRSAWLHLKEAVEIEINSVTDNPLVFSEDLTISGGNFHGQPLALPLDYACLAISELGSISDRRTYLSLEGKYPGTPKLLMKDIGLNSGFMILQYTSAALASENKGLCFPSSADSIPTSLGQEDHVSMGSIGGRKALQVCGNVTKILAIELLCAAQAFDFRKPLKSGRMINQSHDFIRKIIPHAIEDRIFSKDIEKAIEIIKYKKLYNHLHHGSDSSQKERNQLFEVY